MCGINTNELFLWLKDGNTALHLAVNKGKLSVAKALLISGADPSIRNKVRYQKMPLMSM